MSLTSFINNADVKKMFQQEFKKPLFKVKLPLIAPPQTHRYGQVGTAYDYLLRFCLKRKHRFAVDKAWVSEIALKSPVLLQPLSSQVVYHIDKNDNISRKIKKETLAIAKEIVRQAKVNCNKFKQSGIVNKSLINSALQLAQLDPVYRAGYLDDNLGKIDPRDIRDLKNILDNTDLSLLKAKSVCLLNPTFGQASVLVGGADADLVIDDKLIDIKTTKKLSLGLREFNQLIGYYVLYRIGHIDCAPKKHRINYIGIYYSRFNYMHLLAVKDIVNEKSFPKFVDWFAKRARKEFLA